MTYGEELRQYMYLYNSAFLMKVLEIDLFHGNNLTIVQ